MAGEPGYNIDIVFCINGTEGMGPFIEKVKDSARNYHGKLAEAMAKRGLDISTLRVKVIVFRDYFHDGGNAMEISNFFTLPGQKNNFNNFLSSVNTYGGGDGPDSALEAIALAMKSDWNEDGLRKRHVVIMWTNAAAHKLEEASGESGPVNYPREMPATFDELSAMWNDYETKVMNTVAKRLIIFGPDIYPWSTIGTEWELAVWIPFGAGEKIYEVDMEMAMNVIYTDL